MVDMFNRLLGRLKDKWYYIIRADDWDRYYREVFAHDELVCIASSQEEAYMKLWEFVECDLSDNED